ncbi:hypothetical protein ACWIUD_11465 [Helicobacter sp. 23-1044]
MLWCNSHKAIHKNNLLLDSAILWNFRRICIRFCDFRGRFCEGIWRFNILLF